MLQELQVNGSPAENAVNYRGTTTGYIQASE